MADTQTYYDSSMTGAELEEALRQVAQIDTSVQQAEQSALLSRSWAQGGTGIRADESENNARYWCDQARQATLFDPRNYYTCTQSDARYQLPVGYIFDWAPVEGQSTDLSTPQKVAAHFGYGTWKEITGRFTFGRSSSHAVGTTGGEETHTLTEAELPQITGSCDAKSSGNNWGLFGTGSGAFKESNPIATSTNTNKTTDTPRYSKMTMSFGGGQSHNNMPPYLTVYKWQRIA